MKRELIYSQSKGVLWERDPNNDNETKRLGKGYSGQPPYVNDGAAQALKARGPIPRGSYRVEHAFDHVRLGPLSMFLRPDRANDMMGRSGFFIHGDNSYGNNTASNGCIVLNRTIRAKVADLAPITLVVID